MKKTSIADKAQTGKILSYRMALGFDITATNNSNEEIVFSKVYSKQQNYKASDIHLNTINNEKKVVESLIETIANEIQIDLNSVYQKK